MTCVSQSMSDSTDEFILYLGMSGGVTEEKLSGMCMLVVSGFWGVSILQSIACAILFFFPMSGINGCWEWSEERFRSCVKRYNHFTTFRWYVLNTGSKDEFQFKKHSMHIALHALSNYLLHKCWLCTFNIYHAGYPIASNRNTGLK